MRSPWLAVGMVACCAVAGCAEQAMAPPAGPTPLAHVIAAGSDDVRSAELDVVSNATAVEIDSGNLHGQLYEVTTPQHSNGAPVATVDGDVVAISLASTRQPGPSSVRIVLSSQVGWRIKLDGGATSESVHLTGARLESLDFGAGCAHIDATLPTPSGTVPVTMSGGVSSFALHVPSGVPARLWLRGGAGDATVDGASRAGVAAGTVVEPADWLSATDRYVIDDQAGVSSLRLDRAA